ncbi:hypothetical protein [Ancylobacter pratisalsi]|uniref:Gluconate 2-dehydrogenase subunit 3 family protein n=1 Tax=Ancylobacter pratisalsi TaxID=1745854 RepID=A0A6P1YR36_9HYPH|nr:hypothetical protein [Ancylobacter pratisalsi]QIB35360.1 hypothetical protein G3A50_17830 [Ancylobacter pratisalsi]
MSAITAHKDPKLPPAVQLPEGPDWVNSLTLFDAHVAETLVAVVRTLYPHEGLPERVYRRTVFQFDTMAAKAPGAAQTFAELIDLLDGATSLPFIELTESYRVRALKGIEESTAFRLVQRSAVRFLYDDIEVWQAFGYEGASVQLGGYVNRGFNDLDWLPDPPPGV